MQQRDGECLHKAMLVVPCGGTPARAVYGGFDCLLAEGLPEGLSPVTVAVWVPY